MSKHPFVTQILEKLASFKVLKEEVAVLVERRTSIGNVESAGKLLDALFTKNPTWSCLHEVKIQ